MCKSCRTDFDALDEIRYPLHYRLALALARYTDRNREAWPAIRTLAEMVKKPPTTVHRALVAMDHLGYIERHNLPGKSTRYRIAAQSSASDHNLGAGAPRHRPRPTP
jgi:DNA-binding IclR family transcriptional regulator